MSAPDGLITPRRRVIELLLARGALSRTELARSMHLSKPTISATVTELIAEGVVQEVGVGASAVGRKPILLRLGGMGRLVVGVEIDVGVCRLMLVTLDGERLTLRELIADTGNVDVLLAALVDAVDALLLGRDRQALLGCGVAVPGVVNVAEETVDCMARLGWRDVPLQALLARQLGVPVVVTDRGKAAGLGELWYRGRENHDDLLYLFLGRGVAGAVVLGYTIHLGPTHTAGEFGHMVLDPAGPPCVCGRSGCLEAFVATGAMRARLRGALADGRASTVTVEDTERADGAMVTAIGAAADHGDALACDLIAHAAYWLGIAVANLVNMLNPSLIVLGGPLAQWDRRLIAPIERALDAHALPVPRRVVRVVASEAKETAPSLGAAALMLQRAGELLASTKTATLAGVISPADFSVPTGFVNVP